MKRIRRKLLGKVRIRLPDDAETWGGWTLYLCALLMIPFLAIQCVAPKTRAVLTQDIDRKEHLALQKEFCEFLCNTHRLGLQTIVPKGDLLATCTCNDGSRMDVP